MYKRVGQPAFLHNKKGRSSTVTNSTSSPAESDVGHTRPNRQRRLASWLSFWLSVVAGTLWIGPAIVLLYFNFSQWIIGASAWCPNGQCIVFSYLDQEMSTAQKIARNEKWNHDLLGALQFAAKAMEVWFVFVAGSLVYMVICVAAKGPQGFPIGFLMQHVEYSDLRNLINPVLCTAPQTPHYRTKDRTRHKIHLYLFALFAGSMTILANLMGPSAAVSTISE